MPKPPAKARRTRSAGNPRRTRKCVRRPPAPRLLGDRPRPCPSSASARPPAGSKRSPSCSRPCRRTRISRSSSCSTSRQNMPARLPALLARHTRLPVQEATEGVRVETNHVYVVPPNAQMELVDGHLHLGPPPRRSARSTRRSIFSSGRSPARCENQAIGVVLSGTASDGALGVREIKAMGGITLAQEPASAKYDGMPRSAIATQMIDLVLPPAEIADQARRNRGASLSEADARGEETRGIAERTFSDEQLDRVFKSCCSPLAASTSRITRPRRSSAGCSGVWRCCGWIDVEGYIAHLEETPGEAADLHNDLLIHVTRFFREPEAFERSPAMSCRTSSRRTAEKTDPGVGRRVRDRRGGLFARDRSATNARRSHRADRARFRSSAPTSVRRRSRCARHGLYPLSIAADVSPERLRRFFTKADGGYRVSEGAPRHVRLRPAGSDARSAVLAARPDLLSQRAHLHGRATAEEAAGDVSLRAQAERRSSCSATPRPSATTASFSPLWTRSTGSSGRSRVPGPRADLDLGPARAPKSAADPDRAADNPTRLALNEANRLVLDRFAPPSVLVDQNFHVVQFNGQTGLFLEPSPGEPSFHMLKLRVKACSMGCAARCTPPARPATGRAGRRLRVRHGATWWDIDVEVIPMMQQSQPFYLVLFENRDQATTAEKETAGREPRTPPSGPARERGDTRGGARGDARVPAVDRSRSSKPPTRSCSPPTRRSCRATRSSRAPTRSSTRRRRSCSRPTRSSTRSTTSCRGATRS